jgi:nitrilase
LIVVPAAFTYTTGSAHWEVLLRARHRKPVLCAGLGAGRPASERPPHLGHSMLIDPWGEVKAVLPEGEGVVSGEIDLFGRRARSCPRHRTLADIRCAHVLSGRRHCRP